MSSRTKPIIDKDSARCLVEAYQASGDDDDLQELFRYWMPVLYSMARRFGGSKGQYIQEALQLIQIGIWNGLKHVDTSQRGWYAYLLTYARGEVLNYLRDHQHLIRIPRSQYHRDGEPVTPFRITDLSEWRDSYDLADLDTIIDVDIAKSHLSDAEAKVFQYCIEEGRTQRYAAKQLGYSQMHIGRLAKSAREKVLNYIEFTA